jgi:hypothetical protein
MANHLIIGLGGTGGKILREMRKRIYEEFRSNDPSETIRVEYLYVDSDEKDLNNTEEWKTMGASVHLLPAQKVSIHGIQSSVLENLHQYPGIKSFINDEDIILMRDIGALITTGIGGQRRRLGRLLFANNLCGDHQKSFITQLKKNVSRLTEGNVAEVTFHICAGLAGGTGSGSIIDAIAQIRNIYGANVDNQYKLHLYLFVPEIILTQPSYDYGFYQPNGYAALTELNALSIGVYKPYDISGAKCDENGRVERLLQNANAFDAAFLFSNINQTNKQLNINNDLPAAVADFLFQKIVTADMNTNGQMQRLISQENNGAGPELDGASQPIRSRRFLSFGIKRVEYPETEIKEYVTYSFAHQATRQLQFNLWRDGIGFDECTKDEIGLGFADEIKDKGTREQLLLSDQYLTLSKPIVDDNVSRRWKIIQSGWEAMTQRFAADAQKDKEKKNWLNLFSKDCELQYNTNYRGHGVKEFYKLQKDQKRLYAVHIRRHIEASLFDEWNSGTKSILEIEKYTSLLIEDCENRVKTFTDNIAAFEKELTDRINPEIKRCNEKWNDRGWFSSASKILSAYKTAKCDYYTYQTLIDGFQFANVLIQEVKIQLDQMLSNITAFKTMLNNLLERVKTKADAKCKPQTANYNSGNSEIKTIKKYDPAQIRNTTQQFLTNQQAQKHNASQIRSSLVGLIGEGGIRSFDKLFDRLDLNAAEDLFVNVCLNNAEAMMRDLATADPTQRMVNVNILEKIKQEYSSDESLGKFILDLVNSAKCYLQFNDPELSKSTGDGNRMMTMLQLSLPDYNDPSNFRQKFITTFAQSIQGDFNPNTDVSVNYKSNQIVVVAATSGFPLRFLLNLETLKQVYDRKLTGDNKELHKMVLHTESFAKRLPELFEKDTKTKTKELMSIALLAYAMKLPADKTDPTTGATFKAIEFVNEYGLAGEFVNIGRNILQAAGKLAVSDRDSARVTELVESKLKSDYLHNTQKAELKKSLSDLLNTQVLPLCKNNDMDPVFVEYRNAAIKIMQNELAEK